jgi:hypothetical protein
MNEQKLGRTNFEYSENGIKRNLNILYTVDYLTKETKDINIVSIKENGKIIDVERKVLNKIFKILKNS